MFSRWQLILTLADEHILQSLQKKMSCAYFNDKWDQSWNENNYKFTLNVLYWFHLGWDQSDKFMKIYITLNGVHKIDKSQVTSQFKDR